MAAAAILIFRRMLFWALSSPHMANMKQHTKFGANCSRISEAEIHLVVYFQDGSRCQ